MHIKLPSLGFSTLLGSMAILYGCSTQTTAHPSVVLQPVRDDPHPITPTEWSPKAATGIIHYSIEDSSEISINNNSAQTSSIQTRTIYSLSYTSLGDSTLLDAKVDSQITISTKQNSNSQLDTNSSKIFHTMLQPGSSSMTVTEQNISSCTGGIDPVGARLYELIVSYPKKNLTIGDKWNDTISAVTCRGKTSLLLQSVRRYELLALSTLAGERSAKIHREVTTIFLGRSPSSTDRIGATGTGSSSNILFTHFATGILISSDGHAESTLTLSTSRGKYPFTQSVITHIEKR